MDPGYSRNSKHKKSIKGPLPTPMKAVRGWASAQQPTDTAPSHCLWVVPFTSIMYQYRMLS